MYVYLCARSRYSYSARPVVQQPLTRVGMWGELDAIERNIRESPSFREPACLPASEIEPLVRLITHGVCRVHGVACEGVRVECRCGVQSCEDVCEAVRAEYRCTCGEHPGLVGEVGSRGMRLAVCAMGPSDLTFLLKDCPLRPLRFAWCVFSEQDVWLQALPAVEEVFAEHATLFTCSSGPSTTGCACNTTFCTPQSHQLDIREHSGCASNAYVCRLSVCVSRFVQVM